jgi:hypothetical protein
MVNITVKHNYIRVYLLIFGLSAIMKSNLKKLKTITASKLLRITKRDSVWLTTWDLTVADIAETIFV